MSAAVYRHYLLLVLLVIYAFNFVDRFALGLLLQDIKTDLSLTDTQLGLLTGIAFGLFYSIMGIPIARWADRGNRVTIITLTTGLWSAALALCGWVSSFSQLLLIRVGVSVGEAGCLPPAQSLIADYFDRGERPKATGIYMLGVPLGAVIAFFLAAWLNELFGWRMTFVLLGLPGLGFSALAWLTLKEPRRAALSTAAPNAQGTRSALPAPASLKEVAVTLWSSVTFRHLLVCWSLVGFFGAGILQWKPAFFIRSYGMQTAEVGVWFAANYGVAGVLGLYLGGSLASRFAAQNERLQFKVIAAVYCSLGLTQAGMFLSPSPYWALGLMALSTLGIYTAHGPLLAAIQSLTPPHMRATAIAIVLLSANLLGLGLGPLAAGMLSDALQPHLGNQSLRWALVILCSGYLWITWHLWSVSKTVMHDLERAGERL
jgi:MFS transporter, Spinster family, sphingosine-1-phosphate transporter